MKPIPIPATAPRATPCVAGIEAIRQRRPFTPIVIEASERFGRDVTYHAQQEGGKTGWGCGSTVANAVDSFLVSHPEVIGLTRAEFDALTPHKNFCNYQELFGIKVVYLGRLGR